MTAPRFPPELERIIFETAAWNDPPTMQSLVLVAHRVCIWIEPLLYRVVRIADKKSLSRIQNLIQKKPALAKKHITHLAVTTQSGPEFPRRREIIHPILTACPHISNLFLPFYMIYPALLDDLQVLTHLTRLSVDLPDLLSFWDGTTVPPTTGQLAVFQLLTHLNLFGGVGRELLRMINNTTFPALTHIAHRNTFIEDVPRGILQTYPTLQLLVCYYSPDSEGPALELETRLNDPRFCAVECGLYKQDWEQGAWGEEDLWSRAAKRVAERAGPGRSVE
ncbi:hypothetical protein C8F01DRAFT_1371066 [Mycena amicta]|nr:hypothetical protein C8F01DRAFT_1371066 [Mycena amicta]